MEIQTNISGNPAPRKSGVKIPALDGVRGIAIIIVMLSHFILKEFNCWTNETAYNLIQSGWLGVDLFFVLSGFLITGILLDARTKPNYWRGFYRRRLLRIFPLYYTAVIITWLVIVFVEKTPERLHGYDSFGWFFAFAPNIAMGLKDEWLSHSDLLDLNHLWSLAIEEQFYLFWPLVVRFVPIRWLAVLCILIVHFSTPMRYEVDSWYGHYFTRGSYVLPFCRFDGLAAGAFLAIYFRLGWQYFVPYHKWIVRALFVLFGYGFVNGILNGHTQYHGTLSALFFASFLYLSLNENPKGLVRRFCENSVLRHFGKYSYALYIFHQMLKPIWLNMFGNQLQTSGMDPVLAQSLYIVLATIGTYILTRISWVLIEQPFLRMKSH